MKKVKAFLVALVLFLLTVTGCHLFIQQRVAVNNPEFSTWPLEEKGISFAGLTENMNEGTIPVFGSSEFQHGKDTVYHPANVFAGNRFNPMLIGAGYYQCLSHAITLAAIEPSMIQRKAVLILSPQWFRKPGVVDQAYASRFSEILYVEMLKNENVSHEAKTYISQRTAKLLSVDETTRDHVALHEKVLWKKEGSFLEKGQETLWNLFLKEKDQFGISLQLSSSGIQMGNGIVQEDVEPLWAMLLHQAEEEGSAENQNQFFIDNGSYKKLESVLDSKKGMNKDAKTGYQNSPEYDDLRCFLQICGELGIEPMVVIVPVNGYYYDFTEFPKEARQGYYAKVRGVAEEYGARIADFSDQEYTKYFFEDRVHLGKKGWVMVNESIYEFYREAETAS